jgi:hypothetical protein
MLLDGRLAVPDKQVDIRRAPRLPLGELSRLAVIRDLSARSCCAVPLLHGRNAAQAEARGRHRSATARFISRSWEIDFPKRARQRQLVAPARLSTPALKPLLGNKSA